MRVLFELVLIISLLTGGSGYVVKKVFQEIRKAVLTKAAQGLPPLRSFNQKLTGKKFKY
ncbi:MAG: hypothetical protein KAQ98_05650 [Bacteriovoracaceae bacterium]|nr:hypothetical protein [Bacteriovoracaceae bacterium]